MMVLVGRLSLFFWVSSALVLCLFGWMCKCAVFRVIVSAIFKYMCNVCCGCLCSLFGHVCLWLQYVRIGYVIYLCVSMYAIFWSRISVVFVTLIGEL